MEKLKDLKNLKILKLGDSMVMPSANDNYKDVFKYIDENFKLDLF